jgi:hypothetical protein
MRRLFATPQTVPLIAVWHHQQQEQQHHHSESTCSVGCLSCAGSAVYVERCAVRSAPEPLGECDWVLGARLSVRGAAEATCRCVKSSAPQRSSTEPLRKEGVRDGTPHVTCAIGVKYWAVPQKCNRHIHCRPTVVVGYAAAHLPVCCC